MYGEHAQQPKNWGVKLPIGVVENLALEEAFPTPQHPEFCFTQYNTITLLSYV
jgi:hypothetical protein